MNPGDMDRTLREMKYAFHLKVGMPPNTILVPYSRRQLFVDGVVVEMGGEVDPKLILDALEKDEGTLVIHDMTVRLSKTVEDVGVCLSDQ